MKNINMNEYVQNLYLTDEYIIRNPSLHEEDSPWKVSKIIPLIDRVVDYLNEGEINLLDVGGGAGLILNALSSYIEKSHDMKVNKFALDLSPNMLEIQKKRNPDLKGALNEDICKTSLASKEVDLTLMIDVLEHVPNVLEALQELRRISRFVVFKVPLQDHLLLRTWNFINRGKPRQHLIENVGHINFYRFSRLRQEIEKNTGQVLNYYFTNVFDYFRNSEHYSKNMGIKSKLANFVAAYTFKLSPKLCSLMFGDFVMILVKCY